VANNDFSKQIKNLSKKIEQASPKDAELKDIINDSFVSRNTKYQNSKEFFDALPVNLSEVSVNLQELSDEKLDQHINENTNFSTWISFLNKALEEFMAKKLKNAFK
jgi:seryl-tRNA synthetase